MKRFFMSAAVMLLAAMAVANAQPHHRCGQDWRDRVRSERVAFLTAEMNLTPAEAEDFWPVYNRIQQERRDAQKEIMEAYRSLEALVDEGVSGKAMSEATDRYLAAIGQKNKVCGKGYEELMKVLPPDYCSGDIRYIIVDVSDPNFIKDVVPLEQIIEVYEPNRQH